MREIRTKKMAKSILIKITITKNIYNMSQGPPNSEFMQEKVQKGDFLWCPMMKTNFSDSTHQECMIFARTGHGSCYLLPLKWDLRRCVGPWSRVKVCRSKLCFFQNDPLMGGHKNPVLPSPPHSPPKSDIINALSLLNEAYNTRKHLQAYGTDCSYLCSA